MIEEDGIRMNRVTSADGTLIAFDRLGDGQPVIWWWILSTSEDCPLAEEQSTSP